MEELSRIHSRKPLSINAGRQCHGNRQTLANRGAAPRRSRYLRAAAAGLALALLSGCSLLPAEEEALPPPLVKPASEKFDVVEVAKGNISTFLRGTAHVAASKTINLSFRESGGRVKQMQAKLGAEVKAGEVLVELETGDLDLQARLQRLNVERAELMLADAKKKGAAGTELRLKEIDLERERIAMDSLNDKIAKSRLVSPIDGVVTYLAELSAGDFVQAFSTVLTIADPSGLQLVYAATNAKELIPVEVNMPVTYKLEGSTVTGKVLQTPSSSPVTTDKTIAERNNTTLILSMDKLPEGIAIGDSIDFEIPLQKRENVLVLPRNGVRSFLGRNYVQVSEGERRKEVDVELGLTTPTQVEIVQGLEEGQKVILNN